MTIQNITPATLPAISDRDRGILRRSFLRAIPFVGLAGLPAVALAITEAPIPSPDDRIEAAIAEITAAFKAKHTDWRVQVKNDYQRSISARTGASDPYCQAVLIYASSEVCGPERAGWYRDYL